MNEDEDEESRWNFQNEERNIDNRGWSFVKDTSAHPSLSFAYSEPSLLRRRRSFA